jgi:hypothetical protein
MQKYVKKRFIDDKTEKHMMAYDDFPTLFFASPTVENTKKFVMLLNPPNNYMFIAFF